MQVLYWLNVGLKDTTEELVQKKEKSKRKKDGELSVFEREREKKREKAKLQKKDKKNKEKQLDIQSKVFTSAGPDPHVPPDLSARICRFYDYLPRATDSDLGVIY